MVTFNEDDNVVDMTIEGDEFPSDAEVNNDKCSERFDVETSEEEGEISFNNNATAHSEVMPKIKSVVKSVLTEEEKEDRLVKKTVEKLQEIMTLEGYMKMSVGTENEKEKACKNPERARWKIR